MFRWLSRDGRRLLAARGTRSFGYGFLAVALGSYLKDLRYTGVEVGLVLTVALASAALSSIAVGFRGDAWGRRRVLMAYALLMAAAGPVLPPGPPPRPPRPSRPRPASPCGAWPRRPAGASAACPGCSRRTPSAAGSSSSRSSPTGSRAGASWARSRALRVSFAP